MHGRFPRKQLALKLHVFIFLQKYQFTPKAFHGYLMQRNKNKFRFEIRVFLTASRSNDAL